MSSSQPLNATLADIDKANLLDPFQDQDDDGQLKPKEWLYGQRMSAMLASFYPKAEEALQIACRAQHIQRWQIPRIDYPANRPGYLKWRKELGRFHAEQTATIMEQNGYQPETIDRVKTILQKQGIKKNTEVQIFEDVICLVFVKYYLEDFAEGKDPEKLANIIRKTWAKMSDNGQAALLQLDLKPHLLSTLQNALSE